MTDSVSNCTAIDTLPADPWAAPLIELGVVMASALNGLVIWRLLVRRENHNVRIQVTFFALLFFVLLYVARAAQSASQIVCAQIFRYAYVALTLPLTLTAVNGYDSSRVVSGSSVRFNERRCVVMTQVALVHCVWVLRNSFPAPRAAFVLL
jgi:hypothetical protein